MTLEPLAKVNTLATGNSSVALASSYPDSVPVTVTVLSEPREIEFAVLYEIYKFRQVTAEDTVIFLVFVYTSSVAVGVAAEPATPFGVLAHIAPVQLPLATA